MAPARSPIGLFAYNRPAHLSRALAALTRCPELAGASLTIFCDGPKASADAAQRARIEETRSVARAFSGASVRVVERPENLGLAASMRNGVGALCDEHGRAIILEDDLEVSSTFLTFMERALDHYADEPKVMQVSGYMFPVAVPGRDDALFLPIPSCWGWGVWKRSWDLRGTGFGHYEVLAADAAQRHRFDLEGAFPYWKMLSSQRRGEIDSWGIEWYLDVFARGGLTLYPTRSLVANRGHDGSGAHREESSMFEADAHDFSPVRFPPPTLDPTTYEPVREFVRGASAPGLLARASRLLRGMTSMLGGGRA